MGILRASYLKQNIGGNVDIFLQNKRKLTAIIVVCCPCSRKWQILKNIGDFEGLAFGVYLSIQILQISNRLFRDPVVRHGSSTTFICKKQIVLKWNYKLARCLLESVALPSGTEVVLRPLKSLGCIIEAVEAVFDIGLVAFNVTA